MVTPLVPKRSFDEKKSSHAGADFLDQVRNQDLCRGVCETLRWVELIG